MRKILFFAIMIVAQQMYSQNSFLLRNVCFSDEEFEIKRDTAGNHISWNRNYPLTDYRFIFIEFSIDLQYNLHSNLPFDLFLYCSASDDTIPLEFCDTSYSENGKTILRAYCAITEKNIPGGREFLLKDVFYDYIHIIDSMKHSYAILYYDKRTKLFSNIRIPQIEVISPQLPYQKKIIFRKCYCPIDDMSLLKKSLFKNNLMPIEDED